MKYVKQVGIIWGFTMAGEILHAILPLPVPSGVYGLFLLLGALMAGWVRLESVEGTGNFLMDTMTLMFIPAMVGLMEYAAQIKEVFVPFMIVIAVSTVAVMVVTGRVAQTVIDLQERGRGKRAEERRGNSVESRGSAEECRENASESQVSTAECRENAAKDQVSTTECRENAAKGQVSTVECRENAAKGQVSAAECHENTADPLDCPAPQPDPLESEEEQTNAR
ncbi:CidA/LrgA family protein [Enterocloster lavalensis]|uniref:CidA/LrgA family protein n=1 Tax=Enterocloster lavalensis TaxID=460384 RepID=UPI002ED40D60